MPVPLQRGIFADGTYADVFRPDTPADPFHALYSRKRDDVIAALSRLPPGSTVLDLGGGHGRLAVPLARRLRVTLCDISERMLTMAVDAASSAAVPEGNLVVQRLDASAPLPFASASFDAVVALDLLVHLADPPAALKELGRVIRPEGRLLVDMTNSNPLWVLRYPRYVGRSPGRWIQTLRGSGVLPDWQSIVRHRTRSEFEFMLRGAGFAIARRWDYGPRLAPKWFLTLCLPEGARPAPEMGLSREAGTSAHTRGTSLAPTHEYPFSLV